MHQGNKTLSWSGLAVFLWGIAWIYCHVCFCSRFLTFEKQWRFEEFQGDLNLLLIVNAITLLYVLLAPGADGPAAERRFGLIGAFILGITPLGLAGLAFVTTLPYFEQSLKIGENKVDLGKYHSVVQGDIRIWLGLDISKSVLRSDGNVAAGLCGLTEKLLGVEENTESGNEKDPLALSGISGMKLNSKATVRAFLHEFAAEPGDSINLGVSNFTEPWPRDLSGDVCERMKALSVKRVDNLTAATDVVKFFEAIEPPASEALKAGHRVVILVVSDLLHDLPGANSSGVKKKLQVVAQNLLKAQREGEAKCKEANGSEGIAVCPQLAVVGLLVPEWRQGANQDSAKWIGPIDTRPILAELFHGAWYDFNFREMSTVGRNEDQLVLRGMLATEVLVEVNETLFLRPSSGEQGTQFTLIKNLLAASHRNSDDSNCIAFKLRPWPDRGSLPDEINISIEAAPEGQTFPEKTAREWQILNSSARISDAKWKYFYAQPRINMQARLALESHLDIGKVGRIDLLVAVPKNLIVYRIPVVIVPYAGKGAQNIFKLAVYLLMACVVIPCVAHFVAWYWKNKAIVNGWVVAIIKMLWPLALLRRAGLMLLAVSWVITEYLEGKFGKKGGHEAD